MKNIFLLQQLHLYGINIIVAYGCGQSEYQSGAGECCPTCGLGMVVHTDCVGYYSTTCIPCTTGRFMDHPNGLKQCFYCKSCDSQDGLYAVKSCTVMSNTQCGVLDGFYCKEFRDSECSSALKHRQCEPGEAIKTPGNERSDTVCEACPSGFYSPLGINCIRWTDCSVRNELQHREGSSVEDVQCRPKPARQRFCLIPAAASALILILLLIILFIKHRNTKKSDKTSQQVNGGDKRDHGLTETGSDSVHAESSAVPLTEAPSAQP